MRNDAIIIITFPLLSIHKYSHMWLHRCAQLKTYFCIKEKNTNQFLFFASLKKSRGKVTIYLDNFTFLWLSPTFTYHFLGIGFNCFFRKGASVGLFLADDLMPERISEVKFKCLSGFQEKQIENTFTFTKKSSEQTISRTKLSIFAKHFKELFLK